MIGNICVILAAGVFVLDKLVMVVYCRMMRSHDRKSPGSTEKLRSTETTDHKQGQGGGIKRLVSFIVHHFLYGWMRYSVIMTGKIPSHAVRKFFYRYVYCMRISRKTVINGGCEFRSPWNLKAGNCIIMNNCILDARAGITIADHVVFGEGVHIWTEEHDVNSPMFSVTSRNRGPVIIGQRAWICSDSTILPGIRVGEGAVLASRACATKELEAFGIYAGVPAKPIGKRNQELVYELSGRPHWHFY